MNLKRLTAFWLSVVLLIGSVYTGNNYNSYADQKAQEILESFKSENNKDNNSSDLGSITAVKATASDSGEITDGEVYDDTATGSDAIEDGEVATASNANAIRSLRSSGAKQAINKTPSSYIKLFDGSSSFISNPDDFAIGKYGTKTIMLDLRIDPEQDIPEGMKVNVGADVIIPKGFTVNEEASTSLKSNDNWEITITDNDSDKDTIIKFKSINTLTYIRPTFYVEQDAQYLINNLSTYYEYKFEVKLYSNYGDEQNQTLIVESEGDSDTASFSLSVDNYEEPDWSIDVQNNGITYKSSEFGYWSGWNGAADDVSSYFNYDYSWYKPTEYNTDNNINTVFDGGLVVKYHKTKGYVTDDTIFKFVTEAIPKPKEGYWEDGEYKQREYSQVCVRFIDDNGNTIYFPIYDDETRESEWYYNSNTSNGKYALNAAELSNKTQSEDALVKEFKVISDASPANSTSGDILYNEGTLEILVLPNIRYNKLFYENEWDADNTMTFTSEYNTAVVTENEEIKAEGDPITIKIENGTDDLIVTAAGASNLDGTKILQYPYWIENGDDYMDTNVSQPIRLTWKNSGSNWKVYDDFIYTVEYKAPSRYEEALSPVKLTDLRTAYDYGLTYRIYIKNVEAGTERIEAIVGKKNSTEYYNYTPANASEKVYKDGRTTWDGTTGETKLGENEYIYKIEIIKDRLASSNIRPNPWTDPVTLASTILRARNKKINESGDDIPDNTNVELVSTIKANGTTLGTFTQNVTTIEYIDRDTLELTTINSSRSMQVNHATKENGILGTYTLKKYPGTMDYDSDDPPVIVISGDGATITDRVSATNQRLLYVVDPKGEVIDVSDSGTVKASEFTTSNEISPNWSKSSGPTSAYHSSWISDSDSDGKLYNLTELYKALNIDYATKLVIAQDWLSNWSVTNESGATWTKCFYANAIEPGHMNYDNIVKIDGEDILEKQLTYDVELYCKASDWFNNKATDSNAGSHGLGTKKTQNLSKIVYGNKETNISTSLSSYSFVKPTISTNYGVPTGRYDYFDETSNILAKVTVDGFTGSYIDYDNVEYDFSGTDQELLSITTGIGVDVRSYNDTYVLNIKYTTSDGVVHSYNDKLFTGSYWDNCYRTIPFEIAEGTYVTDVSVSISDEGYIWGGNSRKWDGLPNITLARVGADGAMPATYLPTGNAIGYQGNVDASSGRVYDQFNVKCKVTYEDIFGEKHKTVLESTDGLSNYIGRSQYTVEFTGLSSTRTQYSSSDQISYDSSAVTRGGVINATITPDIYLTPGDEVGEGSALRLRPVFYFAIDKDFTPDTASITGLKGASAVFYPAGTGKGYSESNDYGYLVIDLEDVAEKDLPSSEKNYYGSNYPTYIYMSKYTYGSYTIPLILSYDADENVSIRTPIEHMWADVPHDSGRDGTSGNYLADIELGTNDTSILTGAPDIIDKTGKHIISKFKTNSDGNPVMLYRNLTDITGSQIAITTLDHGGLVPYVTENITGSLSQKAVYGRNFTALDDSEGLFGNRIYLVGDSTNVLKDFNVYVPVVRANQTNMIDTGEQSTKSSFGLKYKSIDISEIEKVAQGVTVSYTTTANPGKDGYSGMVNADWKTATPSDLSEITGIMLHVGTLNQGAKPYFDIQYQLLNGKTAIGEQKAYQTFYCNFKVGTNTDWYSSKGITSPNVQEYILDDMLITGLLWDETEKTDNSIYDRGIDSVLEGVEIKLYDKNGEPIEFADEEDSSYEVKTDENGEYELSVPYDGEFIVEMIKDVDSDSNWKLVKKLAGAQTNLNSYGDQETAKISGGKLTARTDVLKLETNYAQGKYTLANINFGLYRTSKLAEVKDLSVHVGEKATPSEIKLEASDEAFAGNVDVVINDPENTDAARKATASDGTVYIEGVSAKKTYADVACVDAYGNYFRGKMNVIPYINIKYDANGGSGEVFDNKEYYVDTDTSDNPERYFVADDGTNIVSPSGEDVFVGWSTDKTATKETLEIQKGEKYSIENMDITKDIVLYAIYGPCDVGYRIEYYQQKSGEIADVEASYELYEYELATSSNGYTVNAPDGYETKYADYKFNATLSNAEITVKKGDTNVIKLYYDIDYKPINWYDGKSPIKKAIFANNGKLPSEEQEFVFTLKGETGTEPLPEPIFGVTEYNALSNTITTRLSTKDALKEIEFGNISFNYDRDLGKTYKYIINEELQDINGYTFDETAVGEGYTMSIYVYAAGTKLDKKVSYSGGAGATDTGITIINTYTSSRGSSSGGGGSSSSTGWIKDSKGWKFRNSDGTLAQGTTVTDAEGNKIEKLLWQRAGYGYYAFGSDGYLVTGWIYDRLNNKWYYCDENVGMLHGWYYENQDGYWYYLSPITGEMQTGWQSINGKEYYFSTTLQAPTYTQNVATGFWVYSNVQGLRPFGSMYANAVTPDNHIVDASGALIK